MLHRREFLRSAATATALGLGCSRARERPHSQDALGDAAIRGEQRPFRGTRPGDERLVDGIALCWCPPGRFVMGSPPSESGRRADEAQVEVRLTRGFWTAKSEATQGQWKRIVGAFPEQSPSPGSGGDSEDRSVRAQGSARRVGSYPPNPWGIHDMHGNVWEWCRDWYHARLPGGTDPDLYDVRGVVNRDGTYSRVRRGGAWVEPGWACRSGCRLRYEPPRRSDHIGFRVVVVELLPA